MFTRPTSFPVGTLFGYDWLDNVYYTKENKERVRGTADLSAKKIVYINQMGLVSDKVLRYAEREVWVPIYRHKPNGDATGISFSCLLFGPLFIPFSVVYNVLRLIRLPFLFVYTIGRIVYDLIQRSDKEKRSRGEVVWDHVVEWFDDLVSSIWTIVENVVWRVLSQLGHLIGFFEGIVVSNPRVGRKIVALTECLANRKVSFLGWLKTEEGQRLAAQVEDRAGGVSLYHSWWSINGPQKHYECCSSYHGFFLAGCFQPIAVGVYDEGLKKIVKLRADSGKELRGIEYQKDQVVFEPLKH